MYRPPPRYYDICQDIQIEGHLLTNPSKQIQISWLHSRQQQ